MFRAALHAGLLFAVVAGMATTTACRHTKSDPPSEKALVGDAAPPEEIDLAPYFAVARAIVTRTARPTFTGPARPGQRVFLTLWSPGQSPAIGTGSGDSLWASVVAAAEAVAPNAPANSRIQIDVVREAHPVPFTQEMTDVTHLLGTHGYLAEDGAGHVGYVLPYEFVTSRYHTGLQKDSVTLDVGKLTSTLAQRGGFPNQVGVGRTPFAGISVFSIATISEIESPLPGRAIALYRAMPKHKESLSADEFSSAARAGADYLARSIGADGRYRYLFDPIEEKPDPAYDTLRHAGATYALLEAYGEFRDPKHLAEAELALHYLLAHSQKSPYGIYVGDNANDEQQKSGGAGLALITLAKHVEVTGNTTNLESMRALGRFIVHQQYPDGHFRENADVEKEDPAAHGKNLKSEIWYFPGEAALGLLRLHEIDPNPLWVDTARKAVDYLLVHEPASIPNHWLTYALFELYRLTKNEAYADRAFAIARSLLPGVSTPQNAGAADSAGTIDARGETTPISTRTEALTVDLELGRYAEKDTTWISSMAMTMACYMRAQQFDSENDYYVKNPAAVIGGVRESLIESRLRIDYTQHAMSAWLRFAHLLRDPNYGKSKTADAGAR